MSVIQCEGDHVAAKPVDPHCTLCSEKAWHPYVHYRCYGGSEETGDLFICADCCAGIGAGLMLDIVQCGAIRQMQRIALSYNVALERTDVSAIIKQREKERREMMRPEPS